VAVVVVLEAAVVADLEARHRRPSSVALAIAELVVLAVVADLKLFGGDRRGGDAGCRSRRWGGWEARVRKISLSGQQKLGQRPGQAGATSLGTTREVPDLRQKSSPHAKIAASWRPKV
jgi:hypothetical protein